jgi:restriction endonuclease Mrr
VQCKRYAGSNTVKIEEVKAFWATLDDVGATRGLVATTSQLEEGARSYCSARRYRLAAAEGEHVRQRLRLLASPDARRDPDALPDRG